MKQENKTALFIIIGFILIVGACTKPDTGLVDNNTIKSGVEIKSKFFDKYKKLKTEESWQEIIDLGLIEINSGKLTREEISQIRLKLASCYYYLGNYQETINQAQQASEALITSKNIDSLARSYYLVSAGYRALTLAAITESKKYDYYKKSKSWIDKAILISTDNAAEDFTRAKVYFNAGALQQDVKANYSEASKYFVQALSLLAKNNDYQDDYNRTAIRNIRCLLELGNILTAEQQAQNLTKKIAKETRTTVHLLQLQSKIAFEKGNYYESHAYATKALKIAKTKSMSVDVQRLEALIKDIINQDPNIKQKLK
jgi:tetratricopeptide (TPR) repeat protein